MKNNYPKQTSRRSFLVASSLLGLAAMLKTEKVKASEGFYTSADKEKGLTFVFHGDSITDGARGRGLDPNHIMGHGYVYGIVSRVGADFPDRNLTFYNRGIGSTKLSDTKKRWQEDALALKPDVLSILIGVNDTTSYITKPEQGEQFEAFENDYRAMLNAVKTQNPKVIFVLGLPFVALVPKIKDKWEIRLANMQKRQAIVRKLAAEFDAVLVDYPSVFEKAFLKAPIDYWIWDGIHPTVYGHELMTRQWIKQVSKRIRFLKHYAY